jgi:predicted PurR-regulated permease PerM
MARGREDVPAAPGGGGPGTPGGGAPPPRADSTPAAGAGPAGLTLGFVAQGALVVLVIWALANVAWMARDVLFITFFALLVASFLSIFVEPLHERGVSRAVSAPVVLILLTLMFTGLGVVAWPTLREQFILIQEQLPPALENV